jgi:hypothetical protein
VTDCGIGTEMAVQRPHTASRPWTRSPRAWWRMLLLLVAIAMPVPGAAVALPDPVRQALPDLRLAGEGRLRWFGLLIYDASLWISGARFQRDREFVLNLRYARNLGGEKIADASRDEMRRLGWRDEARLERWLSEMRRIFPDVRKGEQLTGVNLPGVGVDFYHNGRFAGRIDDAEFAVAFFSIWLDPRTREPGLREALIGRQ